MTGEACITIGAHKTGIIQMISSNASLSSGEISAARPSPSQVLFFQLYKNKDNSIAEKRVKEIESQGYKAIFLTVDAVVASNRERDLRAPFELEDMEKAGLQGTTEGERPRQIGDATAEEGQIQEGKETEFGGTAGSLLNNDDVDMTWEEVRCPRARFVGVAMTSESTDYTMATQCYQVTYRLERHSMRRGRLFSNCDVCPYAELSGQDAVRAAEAGVDGILISNHGGKCTHDMLNCTDLLTYI